MYAPGSRDVIQRNVIAAAYDAQNALNYLSCANPISDAPETARPRDRKRRPRPHCACASVGDGNVYTRRTTGKSLSASARARETGSFILPPTLVGRMSEGPRRWGRESQGKRRPTFIIVVHDDRVVEMGRERNPNRTNQARTYILERPETNRTSELESNQCCKRDPYPNPVVWVLAGSANSYVIQNIYVLVPFKLVITSSI